MKETSWEENTTEETSVEKTSVEETHVGATARPRQLGRDHRRTRVEVDTGDHAAHRSAGEFDGGDVERQ